MRDSTLIYRSFYDAIIELPPADQAILWRAIFEYSLNRKDVDLQGINKTIFMLIKPILQANMTRYDNGKQPKRKRNVIEIQADGSGYAGNKDKDVDKDKEDNKDKDGKPPKSEKQIFPNPELIKTMLTQFDRIEMIQRDCDVAESVVKKWIPKFIQHSMDNNQTYATNAKMWNHFMAWFKGDYASFLKLDKAKNNGSPVTAKLPPPPIKHY